MIPQVVLCDEYKSSKLATTPQLLNVKQFIIQVGDDAMQPQLNNETISGL
jgi:hypothetical protein